jgi:hypothetical protein
MKNPCDLAKRMQAQARKKSAEVVQLPLWNEDQRGIPNEILRSALFTARNRTQKRRDLKEDIIAVIGDGVIRYTGEELRQDDETVWLHLIHLARQQPLGRVVEFTAYSFVKAIGWPICGDSYRRLRDSLTRMQATALKVYSKRLGSGISLSMIPEFEWQDTEGKPLARYWVKLAPRLVQLFGDVHYSRLEWQQRLALPVGVGTWLHGYFSTHKRPYPIKLETIKDGAGLLIKRHDHLKEQVEAALKSLEQVGFLEAWRIEDDLVHVERT